MMAAKFKPSDKGIQELLKSQDTSNVIGRVTRAKRDRAGDGFTARVDVGATRVRGIISTGSDSARRRQARDHVLERVLGEGA